MKCASEFKAWLEGFSESFENGKPNKKQWERIMDEVNELYDRQNYYPSYPYYYIYPNGGITFTATESITTEANVPFTETFISAGSLQAQELFNA